MDGVNRFIKRCQSEMRSYQRELMFWCKAAWQAVCSADTLVISGCFFFVSQPFKSSAVCLFRTTKTTMMMMSVCFTEVLCRWQHRLWLTTTHQRFIRFVAKHVVESVCVWQCALVLVGHKELCCVVISWALMSALWAAVQTYDTPVRYTAAPRWSTRTEGFQSVF